jgi:hypothetical protein
VNNLWKAVAVQWEDVLDRGCTGDFSKKKMFSKTFSSQHKLVDMVCHINIDQDFKKKFILSCLNKLFSHFTICKAFMVGILVVLSVEGPSKPL